VHRRCRQIQGGKPVLRGTRLACEFILERLASGQSDNDVPTYYPGLTRAYAKPVQSWNATGEQR